LNMEKKTKAEDRGMIFTVDMVTALFFFLVIILSMLWVWAEAYRHMVDYRDVQSRQERLATVSSMLVKTPGSPPNWESSGGVTLSGVDAIGLAREPNVLDEGKMMAFMSADGENLRERMGLGSENFSLTVTEDWAGTPRIIYYMGDSTAGKERMIARRYALFNGSRVELKLEAYYNKK